MKPRSGGYTFGECSISQHKRSWPWFSADAAASDGKRCQNGCLDALKYGLARRRNRHGSSWFQTSANTCSARKYGFSPRPQSPRHIQRIKEDAPCHLQVHSTIQQAGNCWPCSGPPDGTSSATPNTTPAARRRSSHRRIWSSSTSWRKPPGRRPSLMSSTPVTPTGLGMRIWMPA